MTEIAVVVAAFAGPIIVAAVAFFNNRASLRQLRRQNDAEQMADIHFCVEFLFQIHKSLVRHGKAHTLNIDPDYEKNRISIARKIGAQADIRIMELKEALSVDDPELAKKLTIAAIYELHLMAKQNCRYKDLSPFHRYQVTPKWESIDAWIETVMDDAALPSELNEYTSPFDPKVQVNRKQFLGIFGRRRDRELYLVEADCSGSNH